MKKMFILMCVLCILSASIAFLAGMTVVKREPAPVITSEPMAEEVYNSLKKGDLVVTPEEVMVAGDFARDGDTRYLPLRSLKEERNCPVFPFPRVRELGNTRVVRKDDPAWPDTVRKSLTQ